MRASALVPLLLEVLLISGHEQPNSKVLCVCHKCGKNTFIKDGITHHGLHVHPRTRSKHLSEASQNSDIPYLLCLFQTDPAAEITVYVMYLVAWLYLFCGLSQSQCCKVVNYITYLIHECWKLLPDVKMETKVPVDVRTITKHLKLDPELDSYVCCQQFYLLYDIKTSSLTCPYKATCKSSATELFDASQFFMCERIPRAWNDRFKPSKPWPKKNCLTNPASIFCQSFPSWLCCHLQPMTTSIQKPSRN
ncbi:hypothetical protein VP01_1793g3 [Puccinia sorghi]|uniref:Uncharacterized protein n=1 Tax=Puccinia sorghi TaxID=27349 RepID=A0A0L6VEG8_9BASI|nr:hypothetical protein VP01_1793g3 [Puccinia sorghi]